LTWVSLIAAVSIARFAIRQHFLRRGEPNRPSAMVSTVGASITGGLWGVGAVALAPAAEMYQFFLAFVVGGMCAGTTAVNSAHLPTVLGFILPAALPMAAAFLVAGSTPHFIAGLMTIIFSAALSLTSLRAHRVFGERIRLQLALGRRERDLRDANERLHREMAAKEEAETTLRQAQKMEAIGHLTGGIAHDFNNLLQVIAGNLRTVRRLADSDSQMLEHIRTMEQAAEQGSRVIASLLAFGRRQALQVERLSVNSLLRDFEPILLRAIGNTIQFRLLLAQDLPRCEVDPTHFQSAILNLVINARDAMPEGGLLSIASGVTTLRAEDLRTNPDTNPGRFVIVRVRDRGLGMTAEILERAVEPLFTTKESGKGSGLGLSQVYGFLRQSGGHLQLSSVPGSGTCVTLCLPAVS
jgi:signal transduction histidine kinase